MATLKAVDRLFGEVATQTNGLSRGEIKAVDLFCGAGGTSTGLQQACSRMGYTLDLLAINHWAVAIETHSANHPLALHKCESLDNVDPRKAIPGGKLDLLVASPECTFHSNASGGAPISDQSRASAWMVLRWCEALEIQNVLIENVPEFASWGPIYEDCTCGLGAEAKKHLKGCHFHRPIQKMKGRIYRAFLSSLRALGYSVSTRVLVAADYGDPTTRRRLFIMARKGKTIRWPEPTHSKHGGDLFGEHPKWRAAREIIDWSVPGTSIYGRSKPLVPNTLRRIAHGLEKFGGAGLRPFIAQMDMGGSVHDIDNPLPTITSADTWTLVDPCMIPVNRWEGEVRTYSVEAPTPTLTGFDALGVVQPFVVQLNGTSAGAISASSHPVSRPLPTVTSREHLMLVEPFVVEYYGTGAAESVDAPLNTITTHDRFALVQPFITEYHNGAHGHERVRSVDEPLPAQDTSNRFGLVEPVIVQSADGRYFQLDIRYRMLMPSELAAAMSFPADYVFTGNRETIVKQIGNAVPVSLASHLCQALLS